MVLRYFLVEIQIPEFTYARTTATAMLQKVQPGRLRGTAVSHKIRNKNCLLMRVKILKTCYILCRMFVGKSTVVFSFSIISN